MNDLIYYPTFEIADPNWLKFALLYIDKLHPIIPESGDDRLTDFTKNLMYETDLIVPHRPNIDEGWNATSDAIEYVERILRRPGFYGKFFGHPDLLVKWKSPRSQKFVLYEEKYANEWRHFCLDNGLGTACDYGIRVHRQLADIYMTLLAQAIADSKGISTITDDQLLDRYYVFARRPRSPSQPAMTLAKATLKISIPGNLEEMSFNQIIHLRNSRDFKTRLAAFHYELDSFLNAKEHAPERKTSTAFVKALGNAWTDFSSIILTLSTDTAEFGLGVWLTVGSASSTGTDFAKEFAAGISLIIHSTIAMRTTWNHTATKRNARRYLSNLSQLQQFHRSPSSNKVF